MPATPLVTIGVAVYNEAPFLGASLESLVTQDYDHLEILISDNASDDGTSDICADLAARDERVRYERQTVNTGAADNFNRVMHLASGDYFTWASGHDLRKPSAISACVEYLEAHPEAVMCFPRTLMIGVDDEPLYEMQDRVETTGMSVAARIRHLIFRLKAGNALYGVIRGDAVEESPGLTVSHYSDLAFLAGISRDGTFHQLDEALLLRRRNRPDETVQQAVERQLTMLGSTARDPRRNQRARARAVIDAVAPRSGPGRLWWSLRVWWWTLAAKVWNAVRARLVRRP